jgi:hypothetical protein
MAADDDAQPEGSNRRSGWLQIQTIGDLETSFEPAFSIWDRLRHIHEAPLKNFRRSFWWFRKTFFTKPPTATPAYLVKMTKPEVVRFFGRHHFEPGWEMSYNYHGEVLNLRRVVHVDHERYTWWQVHIRGFLHGDAGIELTAHYETEPAEHPDANIDLYGLDIETGMEAIEALMDDEGIDYEYLEPDDRTGISA